VSNSALEIAAKQLHTANSYWVL